MEDFTIQRLLDFEHIKTNGQKAVALLIRSTLPLTAAALIMMVRLYFIVPFRPDTISTSGERKTND